MDYPFSSTGVTCFYRTIPPEPEASRRQKKDTKRSEKEFGQGSCPGELISLVKTMGCGKGCENESSGEFFQKSEAPPCAIPAPVGGDGAYDSL